MQLRPLRREDLAAVGEWLAAPHVARWWRDPADAASVRAQFGPVVDGLDPTEVFVIETGGAPVGLVQRYRMSDCPDWARQVGFGEGVGIDYLIGRQELCGRGLGSAAIGRLAQAIFAADPAVTCICAVPQQANVASCRALEKAGFRLRRRLWRLDSGHPGDAGPAFLYVLARPMEARGA